MEVCATCQNPLVLELEPDSEDEMQDAGSSTALPTTIPDSVQLIACGDKFHWQCLLDSYTDNACPKCARPAITTAPHGAEQLLVHLDNEGGLQHNLDIRPLLAEEAHLRAFPAERKPRAFLELCRGGDANFEDIVALLQADDDDDDYDDDDDDEMDDANAATIDRAPIDLFRYQDPLGGQQTALHAAVAAGARRVACLLLYLASSVPLAEFPDEAHALAAAHGFARPAQEGAADVRGLRDAEGRTAGMVAREVGGWGDGEWLRWLEGV